MLSSFKPPAQYGQLFYLFCKSYTAQSRQPQCQLYLISDEEGVVFFILIATSLVNQLFTGFGLVLNSIPDRRTVLAIARADARIAYITELFNEEESRGGRRQKIHQRFSKAPSRGPKSAYRLCSSASTVSPVRRLRARHRKLAHQSLGELLHRAPYCDTIFSSAFYLKIIFGRMSRLFQHGRLQDCKRHPPLVLCRVRGRLEVPSLSWFPWSTVFSFPSHHSANR